MFNNKRIAKLEEEVVRLKEYIDIVSKLTYNVKERLDSVTQIVDAKFTDIESKLPKKKATRATT